MEKIFISAQDLLLDSFKLAAQIYESGFRPDFIIGIWRGGTPIGIAVQEYLDYKGVVTDHIAIRTSLYTGINEQSKTVRVHGLHYIIENINAEDSLLIIIEQLSANTRKNMPHNLKIACPWYKPSNNKVDLVPDYYIHETDKWLVFPHELAGLTIDEIRQGKPELAAIFEE